VSSAVSVTARSTGRRKRKKRLGSAFDLPEGAPVDFHPMIQLPEAALALRRFLLNAPNERASSCNAMCPGRNCMWNRIR
jgi:hypothetical protein